MNEYLESCDGMAWMTFTRSQSKKGEILTFPLPRLAAAARPAEKASGKCPSDGGGADGSSVDIHTC
jgi:hypothetical protein